MFFIPHCVLTMNTPATFGTVVRKYNTHTVETHMLPCTHVYTHTHEQLVCSQNQQYSALPRSSITSWLPLRTTKDRVTEGVHEGAAEREKEWKSPKVMTPHTSCVVVNPGWEHSFFAALHDWRYRSRRSTCKVRREKMSSYWWVPVKGPQSLIPCWLV